jgi:hypothetical protein
MMLQQCLDRCVTLTSSSSYQAMILTKTALQDLFHGILHGNRCHEPRVAFQAGEYESCRERTECMFPIIIHSCKTS